MEKFVSADAPVHHHFLRTKLIPASQSNRFKPEYKKKTFNDIKHPHVVPQFERYRKPRTSE